MKRLVLLVTMMAAVMLPAACFAQNGNTDSLNTSNSQGTVNLATLQDGGLLPVNANYFGSNFFITITMTQQKTWIDGQYYNCIPPVTVNQATGGGSGSIPSTTIDFLSWFLNYAINPTGTNASRMFGTFQLTIAIGTTSGGSQLLSKLYTWNWSPIDSAQFNQANVAAGNGAASTNSAIAASGAAISADADANRAVVVSDADSNRQALVDEIKKDEDAVKNAKANQENFWTSLFVPQQSTIDNLKQAANQFTNWGPFGIFGLVSQRFSSQNMAGGVDSTPYVISFGFPYAGNGLQFDLTPYQDYVKFVRAIFSGAIWLIFLFVLWKRVYEKA
jgi:hypothetical protein